MQRCFKHKISTDVQKIIELKNQDTLDYVVTDDHVCFVAKNIEQSVITLLVFQSVKTVIYFDCHDALNLTVRLLILFPKQSDITIHTFLCGNNVNVTILGMYGLTDQQKISLHSNQVHCGKDSTSRFIMQGLVAQNAQFFYDGTIRIEEFASGTYALQHNKNILLSNTSTAISIPNIEVLNHDVQCYHGAAVGKFDRHQIQYMQSRGLSDKIIQQLLIQALFQEPLQGYENRELILQSVYENI